MTEVEKQGYFRECGGFWSKRIFSVSVVLTFAFAPNQNAENEKAARTAFAALSGFLLFSHIIEIPDSN